MAPARKIYSQYEIVDDIPSYFEELEDQDSVYRSINIYNLVYVTSIQKFGTTLPDLDDDGYLW